MSKHRNFKKLLPRLATLISGEGEYLSHQTALYLHGFISSPGNPITIVSSRRRRNRQLEGFDLVFVFHSNLDPKLTQQLNVAGEQITISSLEKTLVDLLKDQSYSPDLDTIAKIFCSVPYNIKQLLSIAKQTSDTVLKRVSLLLAWSGRASYKEIPYRLFKRTPIKLDNREKTNLVWNGFFYTKLPARLLSKPVSAPPQDTDLKTRSWMELKALPEFCEKQLQSGMIFIRESPEKKILSIIEAFFIEIFKNLSSEQLEAFLAGYDQQTTVFPPKIPVLLKSFIHSRKDILQLRREEIICWISKNLNSSKLDLVESAIFHALKLELFEEAFEVFEKNCSNFFYAGKFGIINIFADALLNLDWELTPKMLLNITKTYSMQEKYEQALELLEKAKQKAESSGKSLSVIGQLHYATGLVFNRMERCDDALSELFLARESFLVADDQECLAKTECSLGNIYFSRGHPASAKSHYISGLNRARSIKSKPLQASFLANLGMVEYDIGNFNKAARYFTQSFSMNKMVKNFWTASVVGMALGKLQLKLGHFSKAMRLFREIMPVREQKRHTSGIYEICSLLAWICEIIGKAAAAKAYWNHAEKFDSEFIEPRSRFVGQMLKAMNYFYHSRFAEAESLFASMLETAVTRNASAVQRGDCLHGLAVAKLFLDKKEEAASLLSEARHSIGINSRRFQMHQINFIAALYFPDNFPDIDLNSCLAKIHESGVYDPLWVHYANALLNIKSEEAQRYLSFHLSKTPPSSMKILSQRLPTLNRILKSIEKFNNRAGEFVTILTPDETHTLHIEDYENWRKNYPANTLIFDAPMGILKYNENLEKLKPGSIPHSILQQLFLAIPHPVEIESLYKAAWGMSFDPEYDFGAVKSSLQRLKRCLKKITSSASIYHKNSSKGIRALKLSVSVPWILVFK
ncbi:MAG: hypothetical protein Kow0029_27370 [Candidatus Rifleibacteriota bacterium]